MFLSTARRWSVWLVHEDRPHPQRRSRYKQSVWLAPNAQKHSKYIHKHTITSKVMFVLVCWEQHVIMWVILIGSLRETWMCVLGRSLPMNVSEWKKEPFCDSSQCKCRDFKTITNLLYYCNLKTVHFYIHFREICILWPPPGWRYTYFWLEVWLESCIFRGIISTFLTWVDWSVYFLGCRSAKIVAFF